MKYQDSKIELSLAVGGPFEPKPLVTRTGEKVWINAPPDDLRCEICHKHVDVLEPFGGAGDPLVGDFAGAKLVKKFREDLPGNIGASWECRECIVIPYASWERREMKKLGRELTLKERRDLRVEIEAAMEQYIYGDERE